MLESLANAPVKVALLIPTLLVGGSERNILLLGDVLQDAGLAVEVWLTSADHRELQTALPVIAIPPAHRWLDRMVPIIHRVGNIRANIARYRPACLISFLESSNIPAIVAGMLCGTCTILSVRGNPQRFNWFYRLMTMLLYRHAQRVVLPSREVMRHLSRHYLLKNTVCIPNIHVDERSPAALPPDMKMSGPLVAVGRLVPGKRFDEVIALAQSLGLARDLEIIGDGPQRAALEAQARSSSLNVVFTGALPHQEVLRRIARARVLLSMSVSECWPNAIAEALAAATPVIARDCNFGPREMIVDGVNGYLIGTLEDARRRTDIHGSLSDPRRYAELSRAARRSAEQWDRDRVRSLWLLEIQRVTP